ncbi:hypothetical protein T11_14444 [Trichinella zimbabwensis]|uniref:Uncharacterized protein n=1 Tax=Trichinella zimbabwensis TaxID=268475 RepID=A0A0V1HPM3_9BILA|nr:hypothetical protein T11_14444 [Trichinella zimbabwensis]
MHLQRIHQQCFSHIKPFISKNCDRAWNTSAPFVVVFSNGEKSSPSSIVFVENSLLLSLKIRYRNRRLAVVSSRLVLALCVIFRAVDLSCSCLYFCIDFNPWNKVPYSVFYCQDNLQHFWCHEPGDRNLKILVLIPRDEVGDDEATSVDRTEAPAGCHHSSVESA